MERKATPVDDRADWELIQGGSQSQILAFLLLVFGLPTVCGLIAGGLFQLAISLMLPERARPIFLPVLAVLGGLAAMMFTLAIFAALINSILAGV